MFVTLWTPVTAIVPSAVPVPAGLTTTTCWLLATYRLPMQSIPMPSPVETALWAMRMAVPVVPSALTAYFHSPWLSATYSVDSSSDSVMPFGCDRPASTTVGVVDPGGTR